MTDTFGATSLPVASVTDSATETIADPGRDIVLSWAAAVITAQCGTAWLALCPNEPIIRKQHRHDPEQEDFISNEMPALFCYRGESKPQRFEDGELGDSGSLILLWVYPPIAKATQATRRGIQVGIGRALHSVLGYYNGRHPSWHVAGDTDPFAATYGSSVLLYGGFHTLDVASVREAEVKVEVQGRPVDYHAVQIELKTREDFVQGWPSGLGLSIYTTINQQASNGDVGFQQVVAGAAPPMSEFSDEFSSEFS